MADVKIRLRDRTQASPARGCRQSWSEYQVVAGRKVLHRADLVEHALSWCRRNGHTVVEAPTGSAQP